MVIGSRPKGASELLSIFFFLTWISGYSVHLWQSTEVIVFLFSLFFYMYVIPLLKQNYNCRAGRTGPSQNSLPLLDPFSISYFLQGSPWFFSAPHSILLPMVSRGKELPSYCPRLKYLHSLHPSSPLSFLKPCSVLEIWSINLCWFFFFFGQALRLSGS